MESTAILWYFYFSNQRLVANAGLGLAALKMAEPVHSWPLTHIMQPTLFLHEAG
jgi:hypothetical protein